MMRRRRGPGLLGVAAVAGTAAYVGNKSAQKGAQAQAQAQADAQAEAAQNQQLAELQAQNAALAAQMAPPQAPPPAAAAPAGIDMAQLKQLGELHTAGVLSDEEFAAAKAKLLA
jgi:hypothetical protein